MALKDIFTMVKADRYTADGREVLNKAREADVEDRRYNIGEISQKTGLQKTANGWVKPKSGKQTESKPAEGRAAQLSKPTSEGWEETQMASGKIYDTPDRTYRIIERNDWETGEKTFDIRDLKNMRADDIKGIKTLEEAKRIVAENKANNKKEAGRTGDSAPRILTGDTRIRVRKA